MSDQTIQSARRPEPDRLIREMAEYVCQEQEFPDEAWNTAYWCLLDSLACATQANRYPECAKLLGPVVPGADMPGNGARVPGTAWQLDPVTAAFNIGVQIRYLDFNDTWLAAEWGHPSDNIGAILAVADYANRQDELPDFSVRDVLYYMIKAHEIQGVLALENSFNQVGLDHVLLVRLASVAVVTRMLGGSVKQVMDAISNAWMDGGALRAYRHAPNTGSRKSWAAGDACSRAVRLSLMVLNGEMGYPSVLTVPVWGFQDVLFKGRELKLARPLASYVMENVLFKISWPAEFHAQTAVECAIQLHPELPGRLDEVESIRIETQAAGKRIIDKTGPLDNYADRDHCIQYMVALGLIFGNITAESYSDRVASDPRIDALRDRMTVEENEQFTRDYFDADKRAISNAITIRYADGSESERVQIDYPVGHRRRREEGIPLLQEKFRQTMKMHYPARQAERMTAWIEGMDEMIMRPVDQMLDEMAIPAVMVRKK